MSSGEPWVDPATHFDTLRQQLHDIKGQYRTARAAAEELQTKKRRLARQLETQSEGDQSTRLENDIEILQLDLDTALEELKALRVRRDELREAVKTASRPQGTLCESSTSERLSKPGQCTLRVLARINGNERMEPEVCLGDDMDQLLLACAQRLGLRVVKKLYSTDGKRLRTIESMKKNQEVMA